MRARAQPASSSPHSARAFAESRLLRACKPSSAEQALGSRMMVEASMSMCGGPTGMHDEPAGNKSGRTVMCVKFQKELPGLETPPWPGELGQRVYENVSAQAWK